MGGTGNEMSGGARSVSRYLLKCSPAALLLTSCWVYAAEREKPVSYLAKHAFTVHSALGDASVPMEASTDLNSAHPEITRAAIVLHGKGRNVEGYYAALQRAAHEAGSNAAQMLLLAPQFLREEDVEAHHLSTQFLRWHAGSWTSGEPAIGPLPLSTFDVIDFLDRKSVV